MTLFTGGIPTKLDVDRLLSTFDAAPGTSATYDQIAEVIGCKPGSHRFRTITVAWRKRLFREKFVQTTAHGGSVHFLTPDQAHDEGRVGMRRIGRATGRLHGRVAVVNAAELTGERKDRHNLLVRETQAMLETIRKSEKTIAGPKPIATQLRLAK